MLSAVVFLLSLPAPAWLALGVEKKQPDLHLLDPSPDHSVCIDDCLLFETQRVTTYKLGDSGHLLVFGGRFVMSVGSDRCSSDDAVVWLKSLAAGGRASGGAAHDDASRHYQGVAYLQGHPTVAQADRSKTTILEHRSIGADEASVVVFQTVGRVFVKADKRDVDDPRGSALCTQAELSLKSSGLDLWPWAQSLGRQPSDPIQAAVPAGLWQAKPVAGAPLVGPELLPAHAINIAPEGDTPLQVELSKAPDGAEIITIIGRVYVWWRQPQQDSTDEGRQTRDETRTPNSALRTPHPEFLELHADNAVLWRHRQSVAEPAASGPALLGEAEESVTALYVCGNVVMRQGQRVVRADEVYYDFPLKEGIAANATLRSFDASRGIPIYVRAAKLKQLAQNTFEAENVTLTTSEFHTPQLSFNAGRVFITDSTAEEPDGKAGNGGYDAQMQDASFRIYDTTIFRWPSVRSNLQNPDVPLRSIRVGNDNIFGTSLETRWFLARLLGLREPNGTSSTLAVDYYGDRGPGVGVEIDYAEDNYFGRLIGYAIYDSGEDRLGRDPSRRNLEPPDQSRGRFKFQHRHFLPYGWQVSTEVSYLSDENFLEQYYRREFNTGKEQETLVHLKRIEDNWGLSLLAKTRINDFADEVDELPSVEFHWTGQSFLDNKLTLYSDSRFSEFRYRYGEDTAPADPTNYFTFISTRNEVDLPVVLGRSKVVPYIAGTLGYDDGSGFTTQLDGPALVGDEDRIWLGEAGIRASAPQYWRLYPDVNSTLWDLNQLRHVVRPHLTAAAYTKSDPGAEQRDVLNLGVSQRWQTKRGSPGNQRTVNWITLDIDFTWLTDSADAAAYPDRFIWNGPFIPLVSRSGAVLPGRDRRYRTDVFGPTRDYIGTDFTWRVSDTTAVLSDAYFDMQSGVMQQLNVGFSHLCWPNLSYYVGSRYLRQYDTDLGEKGSNTFTFAATYVLDPRYAMVFLEQYDFDSDANIRSDITLIRKYHRVYFGMTFSIDESLDQSSVVFSLWPEGVPELAVGLRRYMGLGDATEF